MYRPRKPKSPIKNIYSRSDSTAKAVDILEKTAGYLSIDKTERKVGRVVKGESADFCTSRIRVNIFMRTDAYVEEILLVNDQSPR